MVSFLDLPDETGPVTAAKNAATSLAAARYEARERIGNYLTNAHTEAEFAQRLASVDVQSVLAEIDRKHLMSVSDGKAKLERTLKRAFDEKVAEKETIHLNSGDVEITKGKLTREVGGPPHEHMDEVRELAAKGHKDAQFYLNVLHKGSKTAVTDEYGDERGCLDDWKGGCEGPVEWRQSLTGTGTPIPRCEKHFGDSLDSHAENRRRYPQNAPRDFDPGYAGERWDED